MTAWPSVGVVIPTRNRPKLLREAVRAVLEQEYAGELEVLVVYDGTEPEAGLCDDPRVRTVTNTLTPGLAGARNTGILELGTDLVAFCDDDDAWLPGKLSAQASALETTPAAEVVSCGIVVDYDGTLHPRLVGRDRVTYQDLLRSRMMMVHSSTLLIVRTALLQGLGLVDEQIPGSQNEDWDLLLRAARRHPILVVDEPLVLVRWSNGSYFGQQWESKAKSLEWMLEHHPDLRDCPGTARVYGQIAFAYACMGRRREAGRWAAQGWRHNWREPRVPIALAVASGIVSGEKVLKALHQRGRGL